MTQANRSRLATSLRAMLVGAILLPVVAAVDVLIPATAGAAPGDWRPLYPTVAPPAWDSWPVATMSDDGSKVVTLSFLASAPGAVDGQINMYVTDVATGDHRFLRPLPSGSLLGVSDDGSSALVHLSTTWNHRDLTLVDTATGTASTAVADIGEVHSASLSGDGLRAIVSARRGSFWQLLDVDLGSGASTQLTFGNGDSFGPVTSDDGATVMFATYATDLGGGPGSQAVLLDVASGSMSALTPPGPVDQRTAAALTGDARFAFVTVISANGRSSGWRLDRQTGNWQLVTQTNTGPADSMTVHDVSDDGRFALMSGYGPGELAHTLVRDVLLGMTFAVSESYPPSYGSIRWMSGDAAVIVVREPQSSWSLYEFSGPQVGVTAPAVIGRLPAQPAGSYDLWYPNPPAIDWVAAQVDDAAVTDPPDTIADQPGTHVYQSAPACSVNGCTIGAVTASYDPDSPRVELLPWSGPSTPAARVLDDLSGVHWVSDVAIDGESCAVLDGPWDTPYGSCSYVQVTGDGPNRFDVFAAFDLSSGTHDVRLMATDLAGNQLDLRLNTPTGSSVTVRPAPSVSVTFGAVSVAGETVATAITAPSPPSGYVTAGIAFDITTTAVYTAPVEVCFDYGGVVFDDSSLVLLHYDGVAGAWEDVTIHPVDTVNDRICGLASSLSPFVLATGSGAGNTPSGRDVYVVDFNPALVVFSTVGMGGNTSYGPYASGVPLPSDFVDLAPAVETAFTTDAAVSGSVLACVSYAGSTPLDEAFVRLLWLDPGPSNWVDITTQRRASQDRVCGVSPELGALRVAVGPASTPGASPTVRPVSVNDAGEFGNQPTGSSMGNWDVSAGGRWVVFGSGASNLVAAGSSTNAIYRRDVLAGETIKVSLAGDGYSFNPVVSDDGQQVAYATIAGSTRVRDLATATSVLIGAGRPGDISADGRWVLYSNNGVSYVHDRDPDGNGTFDEPGASSHAIANAHSGRFSPNARFVYLWSLDNDFLPHLLDRDPDGNATFDDTPPVITPINVDQAGVPGDDSAGGGAVADDGDVVFWSYADNLGGSPLGSTPGAGDVYVRDHQTGEVTLVGRSISNLPSISADARYVAFDTFGFHGDTNDTSEWVHVVRYDRTTGTYDLVARNSSGGQPAFSYVASLSADGQHVLWGSYEPALTGDVNSTADLYLSSFSDPQPPLVTPPNTPVGNSVWVSPAARLEVSFDVVTTAGDTTAAATSTPLPGGYTAAGLSFEITTTAVYSGSIEVCFDYSGLTIDESTLVLLHRDASSGLWEDITTIPVDTANDRICGIAGSLSPFVLANFDALTSVVDPGGTASTDTGSGATTSDPVTISVTSPTGGSVTLGELGLVPEAPSGYAVVGSFAVDVQAPPATASDPLLLRFVVDASAWTGLAPGQLTVTRDGVPVEDCVDYPATTPSGTADPDPCVAQRRLLSGFDLEIVVRTSHASRWLLVAAPNAIPTIALTAPSAPVALGVSATVVAAVADADADALTCTIDWSGDGVGGSPDSSMVATDGSCVFSTTGLAADVYTAIVTVTDSVGATASASTIVVIYDPKGGFVTGGGWFHSPAGAYAGDPSSAGRAEFGFVSRYRKGDTVPVGSTSFRLATADLEFESTGMEWLVISGSTAARFRGTGTVDGVAGYSFAVTAIDGSPDRFRIRIWNAGGVVYDNQTGADVNGLAATAIGGGAIIVHSGK